MKNTLYNIFSRLAITATVVLAALLITVPVAANENQQITNALINPRGIDFFREGQEQFEHEMKVLMMKDSLLPEKLLQINPEVMQVQQQLLPLENHQVIPGDVNSDNSQKFMNQDSEIIH
ncbi:MULTISPECIES: hypothetical protein [unclassified Anabaena]|uniref:hypothetical protein n=1 Tax=unclassified Anabaena TaxID=2619674 RepID=UPI0008299F0F|nr:MULTISPECIES: hypothetical protein [unclassified Anabaena]